MYLGDSDHLPPDMLSKMILNFRFNFPLWANTISLAGWERKVLGYGFFFG